MHRSVKGIGTEAPKIKDGVERKFFFYLAVQNRLLNKGTTIISKQLILINLNKMTFIVL